MFPSFNARAMGLSLDLDQTLSLAAEHGFGGVDVLIRDAVDRGDDLDEARRRMADLGLRPGAFPFPFDWRGDESAFREGMRALPIYAEAAARLGLQRTGTWVQPAIPPERSEGRSAEEATREATTLHLDRLGEIVAVLDRHGVRLGLEVIGVTSSRPERAVPFLSSLAALEPFRRDLEGRAGIPVGVLADSWHLYAAGEPIEAAFLAGADRIVWVHVADVPDAASTDRLALIDSVRGLPGEFDVVPSKSLLAALRAKGYDGPVTAEPLSRSPALAGLPPGEAVRKTAASLRAIWPE